jgi:dienelactone hydrolase
MALFALIYAAGAFGIAAMYRHFIPGAITAAVGVIVALVAFFAPARGDDDESPPDSKTLWWLRWTAIVVIPGIYRLLHPDDKQGDGKLTKEQLLILCLVGIVGVLWLLSFTRLGKISLKFLTNVRIGFSTILAGAYFILSSILLWAIITGHNSWIDQRGNHGTPAGGNAPVASEDERRETAMEAQFKRNCGQLKSLEFAVQMPAKLSFQGSQDGVSFAEENSSGPNAAIGIQHHYYVYRPVQAAAKRSLPCVLIAPAGSNLITGMDLTPEDKAEQLPYVRAGFEVVAYAIDGALAPGQTSEKELKERCAKFDSALAGMVNAGEAFNFILRNLPEVDPNRIYVAGHSSAATLALLYAEHDQRIKGCIAFAPVSDLQDRFRPQMASLSKVLVWPENFLAKYSPRSFESHLDCPVFLFHAEDDDNVPVQQTRNFAARLRSLGKNVTLATASHGGHHDAMIREGIPDAITWLKGIDRGN